MQLVVNGRVLSLDGTGWGDLEWGLCWPGYSDELTFDVSRIPSHFRPGSPVSLVWGGEALWSGTLDEPTRGARLRAAGLYRLGEDYAALDGVGGIELVVNDAIDAAIIRGLPWLRPDNVSTGAPPMNTDSPPTLTDIITAQFAASETLDWGVRPDRTVARLARSTPRLHVRPGGDGLGIAWDNYASTLIARYNDSGSGVYETATHTDTAAEARWSYREAVVSGALNDGAPMTAAVADDMLASMLAKGRARPGWTTPLEVEYGAITGNRGQPIDLATIKPYETIRVHGISEDIGADPGQTYVDMDIERIRHKGPTTTIAPVGLVSPMHAVLSGKR